MADVIEDYERLASEYYDRQRHPTCANFTQLSRGSVVPWLEQHGTNAVPIVEIGAGRSIVCEVLEGHPERLRQVTLVDESPGMLAYSDEWKTRGVKTVLGRAEDTGLLRESAGIVVSCLGDPYNNYEFWREASRLLTAGGWIFFTTPSYVWASSFRDTPESRHDMESAEFELRDGSRVRVPSIILPQTQQLALISSFGLCVAEIKEHSASSLVCDATTSWISPKLVEGLPPDASVLTAYRIMKPRWDP